MLFLATELLLVCCTFFANLAVVSQLGQEHIDHTQKLLLRPFQLALQSKIANTLLGT